MSIPLPFALLCKTRPVSVSVSVTCTPGMTALETSCTTPVMVPWSTCALAARPTRNIPQMKNAIQTENDLRTCLKSVLILRIQKPSLLPSSSKFPYKAASEPLDRAGLNQRIRSSIELVYVTGTDSTLLFARLSRSICSSKKFVVQVEPVRKWRSDNNDANVPQGCLFNAP